MLNVLIGAISGTYHGMYTGASLCTTMHHYALANRSILAVHVRACVRACVRVCVRVCMHACVIVPFIAVFPVGMLKFKYLPISMATLCTCTSVTAVCSGGTRKS